MANESLSNHGGWDSINLLQNNIIFSLCLIAAILHFHIWSQLFIQKTKFDLSFIFSLGYISTDIFLLLFYFIQYSIRIRSWIPVTSISCYFEAYSMFCFNLFESYCLTALNTCRYWQIVRHENPYKFHRRKLIFISIIILSLVSANLIIQNMFDWCILFQQAGASCTLSYTNVAVRIWNLTIVLMTPILISFYILFRALRFLQSFQGQQVLMRRNHHTQLIIHSLIFYSIWLFLWLPLMVIIYLNINNINGWIVSVASIANTLEILADPIIIFFLDKRFAQLWKKFYHWITDQFGWHMNGRVNPAFPIATIHPLTIRSHINK